MFKKVLVVLIAVFAVFALTACKKERTYKADGVYYAFSAGLNDGKPQVTTVSVTIKDDKIESFYIDCVQSTLTDAGYTFNAKSKKELGYAYRMHGQWNLSEEDYIQYLRDNNKKEWFEQAELLEAYFKANGTTLTTNSEGKITNVTGVTIKDGDYSKLAAEAVQNAKDGKVIRVLQYAEEKNGAITNNVVWVEGTLNEQGKLVDIVIDTLQGKIANETFAWNEKSKQELGYAYRMHGQRNLSEADYIEYLRQNNKYEWFEQADMLADYVLANGLSAVKLGDDEKLTDKPTALASVSVTASHYVHLLEELLEDFPR
jgi:hypothetical protein